MDIGVTRNGRLGVMYSCPGCLVVVKSLKNLRKHAEKTQHFSIKDDLERYRIRCRLGEDQEVREQVFQLEDLKDPVKMLQKIVSINVLSCGVIMLMVQNFNQYFALQMVNDHGCNHVCCQCEMIVVGCVPRTLGFCSQTKKRGLEVKCVEIIAFMVSYFGSLVNQFQVKIEGKFSLFEVLYNSVTYGDDRVVYLQVPTHVLVHFGDCVLNCELIFMSISVLISCSASVVKGYLEGRVTCQCEVISEQQNVSMQQYDGVVQHSQPVVFGPYCSDVTGSEFDPRPGFILQRLVRQNSFMSGTVARILTSGKKMSRNFVIQFSDSLCTHVYNCCCSLIIRGISSRTLGFFAEAKVGTITEKFSSLIAEINRFDWNLQPQKRDAARVICAADELKARKWLLHNDDYQQPLIPVQLRDGVYLPKLYGVALTRGDLVSGECDVGSEHYMSMIQMCERLGIKQDLIGKDKKVVPSLVYCCLRVICLRAY